MNGQHAVCVSFTEEELDNSRTLGGIYASAPATCAVQHRAAGGIARVDVHLHSQNRFELLELPFECRFECPLGWWPARRPKRVSEQAPAERKPPSKRPIRGAHEAIYFLTLNLISHFKLKFKMLYYYWLPDMRGKLAILLAWAGADAHGEEKDGLPRRVCSEVEGAS